MHGLTRQANLDMMATAIAILAGGLVVSLALFFIVRRITSPLHEVINEITESAREVASGSSHVSATSQQLAEGASEQAAAIQETSASLEEMTSVTRHNAEIPVRWTHSSSRPVRG
jgi:methyl-accepting chemotaxis protein